MYVLVWLLASCSANSCTSIEKIYATAGTLSTYKESTDSCFQVRNCVFTDFRTSALVINNAGAMVSAIEVTFIKCANWCSCSRVEQAHWQAGGGMFVNADDCEVYRCCGYECEASIGLVLFILANGENKAIDVASRNCREGQDAFRFMYGNQVMKGFNSSTNRVADDGAAFESAWSVTLKMLHCSFLNNRGTGTISLFVGDANIGGYHSDNSYVNVYNNSGSTKKGVVTYMGDIVITKWIFTRNTDGNPPLFGKDEYFKNNNAYDKMIEARECIFDTTEFGLIGDRIGCSYVGHAVTHVIAHWKTHLCPADFSFSFTPFQEPERVEYVARSWKFGAFLYLTTI